MHVVSLAGEQAGRRMPASCWMGWNRLCTTGGRPKEPGLSITQIGASKDPSGLHYGVAAIHIEYGSGHERGGGTGEKTRRTNEVFGRAPTGHRGAPQNGC